MAAQGPASAMRTGPAAPALGRRARSGAVIYEPGVYVFDVAFPQDVPFVVEEPGLVPGIWEASH